MKTVIVLFILSSALFLKAQVISAGDMIDYSIKGVPVQEQAAVKGSYIVDPNGKLHLPYIKGGIKVSGMSTSAAARKVEAAFRTAQIYNRPKINFLTQKDLQSEKQGMVEIVTVSGLAVKPGPLGYRPGMTLFDAVMAAGGPNAFGTISSIKLTRNGMSKKKINLRNDASKQILAKKGDIIEIGKKGFFNR